MGRRKSKKPAAPKVGRPLAGVPVLGKSPAPITSPPGADGGARNVIIISLLLPVLVVWVFHPSINNEFINLDDPWYVTGNVHVRGGFTWENVRWAFATLDGGLWHPLTWLSYMFDCQLFGLRPGGHHLTSLLLHAINTAVLFLALQRMTGAVWRSATVAAFFALHPLHVEPVAWVADRKDVLSACFWMCAMLAYAHYAERSKTHAPRRAWFYLLTLGFYLCGLMSKSTVATLPLVLLLLDWWPLGRCEFDPRRWRVGAIWPLILEKLPLLAAGFVVGQIGVRGQKAIGALPDFVEFPIGDRIPNAILSYGQYLVQTFWPANLAGYYPYPKAFSAWLVAGTAVLGLAVSIAALRVWRQRPYLATGWIWYGLTLLPAIGLIQIGGHARADRYTYVPLIGVFLLVVWGACDLTQHWRRRAAIRLVGALAVLLVCSAITRKQIGYWRDSETFFEHLLAVTEENGLAHSNLGVELERQGRLDEAFFHLREAVRILPRFAEAHNNLGAILGRHGQLDEAVAHLEAAVRLKPRNAEARCNLGDALTLEGRSEDARREYETALRLRPDFADAHNKLGGLLRMTGQFEAAIGHYREAIRLEHDSAESYRGLGIALNGDGRFDEAIGAFHAALQLNPNSAETRCHLGAALGRLGRLDEAIIQLREAIRLKPDYAEARSNLELALRLKSAPAILPPQ